MSCKKQSLGRYLKDNNKGKTTHEDFEVQRRWLTSLRVIALDMVSIDRLCSKFYLVEAVL